jgi:hypothetical protein
MKTIKRKILVVVFMMAAFINYANNSDFKNAIDAKKVTVVFNDVKKGHQLSMKDDHGVVLHSEKVSKQGDLVKTFNFSELENGNYTLELDKDFQIVIKFLEVKNKTVIFNENANKIIFKPFIRIEENKVMISRITFDEKPLEIDIYYDNEIIYSETATSNTILNRVYRLDEAIKGNYEVVVRNNERVYRNEFKY